MSATATVLPPTPLPVQITLVLLPAAGNAELLPAASTPTIPPGLLGWPEGEPTWEDAAWQ